MRVVTQNLLGRHMDWPRRLPAVVDWFRRLRPDVLALQEAVVTTGYDQVTEVLGELDDEYHVVHHPLRERTDLDRRIDYVFVRCGRAGPTVRVTRCERILDTPVDGVLGSDHFGIVAELELVTGNW